MPTTTRRKRAADAAATDVVDGNDKDDNANIDEAEAALAAAKEVRKAKAKRRRLEAKQRLPRFEVLMEQGLMPLVVDLLSDSPRDLITVYSTSKKSQSFITREVVVKASVYQGVRSRSIMKDLMIQVRKKTVFLPSAIRLLRLVNGMRCENGSDCWSYDLVKKAPAKFTAQYTSRPFGLCICKDCSKNLSTAVSSSHWAAPIKRVGDRTLDVPFGAIGEKWGSVATTRDIKQIEKTYRTTNVGGKRSMLDKLIKDRMNSHSNGDEKETIKSLAKVYKDAERKASSFIAARNRLDRERLSEAQAKKKEKKVARMKEIHAELSNLLEDFEHKDIALAVEWEESWNGQPNATFECGLSQEILSGLFSAVSNTSKKKIRTAAEEIRRVYSLAASKNLLSTVTNAVTFLADSQEPADQMLYKYFSANNVAFGKAHNILFASTGPKDIAWLESATNANITNALLGDSADVNDVFHDAPWAIRIRLGPSFAQTIIDDEMEKCYDLRKIAQHTWRLGWFDIWNSHSGTIVETVRHAFPLLRARYEQVRASVSEYLARPDVVSYMETPGVSPKHPSITRRVVVERAAMRDFQCLIWIVGDGDRAQRHAHLRARHECMFDDPSVSVWKDIFSDLMGDVDD